MNTISTVAIYLVVLLQLSFMFLEMFIWNTPRGHNIFRMDESYARKSSTLAANQGLYNGFLAAGLIWGELGSGGFDALVFFLSCIIIAGIYGAMTALRSILWVQALPASIALGLILVSRH